MLLVSQSLAIAGEHSHLPDANPDLIATRISQESASAWQKNALPSAQEAKYKNAIAQAEMLDAIVPGEFSSTLTFTSNYVFRGISQTNNTAAIQGSFDYSLGLSDAASVYAGIFGSNVDFNDGDQATLEVDLYAGAAYQISDRLSSDLTAYYYLYPGADSDLNYDYLEFVANAGYDLEKANLGATLSHAPDNFASSGTAIYTEGRVDVPLPQNISLNAALGYQSIEDNTAFGAPDYVNWSVGAGYSIVGFDLALKYTDTDLSSSECFGGTDLCEGRVVFSASRTF